MKRPTFLSSFFSIQLSGSKFFTSPAKRQSNPVASKWVMGAMPPLPARRLLQTSSVPIPQAQTRPTPVTTTRRLNVGDLLDGLQRPAYYFFAWACFSMYAMASFTVAIFSASSSGISMPNASSKAITSSTVSSESAPRSSTNEAVGVTSPSSTPSCSTIICFTRSSTLAILVVPPNSAIFDLGFCAREVAAPYVSRPFYAPLTTGSTVWAPLRSVRHACFQTSDATQKEAPAIDVSNNHSWQEPLRKRHSEPVCDRNGYSNRRADYADPAESDPTLGSLSCPF